MTIKLPVLTSAAKTDFVSAELVGPEGVTLYIDGNQKISGWVPKPNAFSLVQIEDCPGSTETCRASCYVHGLQANAKNVHDLYRHNSKTIREIIASPRANEWASLMAEWISANVGEPGFRWHVSGDLFSAEYAAFVATVVERSPTVHHWIYTRSFYMTAAFVGLKNISVNYSVDRDNYAAAQPFVTAHAGVGSPVRLCYLVTGDGQVPADLPDGSVIFPDYSLRGARNASPEEARLTSEWYQSLSGAQRRMVCPVDFYGKSERMRCGSCTKCIDNP